MYTVQHCFFTVLPKVYPVASKIEAIRNDTINIKFTITDGLPAVKPNNIYWFKSLSNAPYVQINDSLRVHFSDDRVSLTISNVQPSDQGIYKISVTNEAGTVQATTSLHVYGQFYFNIVHMIICF